MNAMEIGNELVALCQRGEHLKAIDQFYSPEIVSEEAMEMPEMPGSPKMPRVMTGLAAVRGKSEWWLSTHEIHASQAEGPFVGWNKFTVYFSMDVTFKPTAKRMKMTEVGVYTVKDGKIVHEEFMYKM